MMNCVQLTAEILWQRNDIQSVDFGEDAPLIDFVGGPDYFDEECIFDVCDEAETKKLLLCFIRNSLSFGWSVNCELSKLLARKGELVRDVVEPIVLASETEGYSERFLFLSYLACMDKGEDRCFRLLDLLPENSRDGLFLACYKLNTEVLYNKLVFNFGQWMKSEGYGMGSGELYLLKRFVEKWDVSFPNGPHKILIKLPAIER